MADPLSPQDNPLGPGQTVLAMADTPPEVPPSGGFPPGKTPPAKFLEATREPQALRGGAPRVGKQEVFAPSSPAVAKAIRRLDLYIKHGWGTGGDPAMGPAPALTRNIEIMRRGGPMAESIAQHMLKTFAEHPQENVGLPRPVIEHEPQSMDAALQELGALRRAGRTEEILGPPTADPAAMDAALRGMRPERPAASTYGERLAQAGLNRTTFETVLSEIAQDKSIGRDEANALARAYLDAKVNYPNKTQALKEIANSFRDREFETVKMRGVDKASRF